MDDVIDVTLQADTDMESDTDESADDQNIESSVSVSTTMAFIILGWMCCQPNPKLGALPTQP